jgi:hypothetical protein
MAKELLPVVLRLKAWRAQNDISQAEAAELLCRRGLPTGSALFKPGKPAAPRPIALP